jgi:hypothetical protein
VVSLHHEYTSGKRREPHACATGSREAPMLTYVNSGPATLDHFKMRLASKPLRCVAEIAIADDVVAVKDAPGLVS